MTILTFAPRFVPSIMDGTKTHTLCAARKHPPTIGDGLSLRRWSGTAYRSAQVEIRAATCTRLTLVRVRMIDLPRPGSRWATTRHLAIAWFRHVTAIGDTITAAEAAAIARARPEIPGRRMDAADGEEFAHRDGFASHAAMTRWYADEYGRLLNAGVVGVLIGWDGALPT